jgi:hypothetical protein
VLGGGVAWESRSVGLSLNGVEETNMTPEQLRNAAVKSAQVANAINRRFSTHKSGIKVGVARAIRGNYVDLVVDPAYKDNLVRYFQVLRAIELRETSAEVSLRLPKLQTKLLDPVTVAEAAIKLEAIGKPAIDVLIAGAQSHDPKVQFYSAEALAYLDRREAAEPLGSAAQNNSAFRSQALTALSVMGDPAAFDQLRDLLAVPSAETRYGAFRALTISSPEDSLIKGEDLGGKFSYHVLDTQGPPMVHVTGNRRAEVVLFGMDQRFFTPLVLSAGQIMVTGTPEGEISVSKFTPREADQKRVVSTRVDDVVRAIVELGGTYPDVVQALQEAKAAACLQGRFEVDAVPESGRSYEAAAEAEADEGEKPE